MNNQFFINDIVKMRFFCIIIIVVPKIISRYNFKIVMLNHKATNPITI
jgi:hypothetical protein